MKFGKITALLLCLSFLLTAVGCSSQPQAGETAAQTTAAETAAQTTAVQEEETEQTAKAESTEGGEAAAQAEGVITLTDQAGRQVTLEGPAQTLVSCYYVTTYACIALDVDERIVGLEQKAESRPIYAMASEGLLKLPQVGSLKEFNLEKTAELNPDLVLMPKKLMDAADTLMELGIPVLVVNPESHEELLEMMDLIGQACGVEENSQALISYYEEKMEEIAFVTALRESNKPVVYMGANSSYMETAPDAMYQAGLIQSAGGINAAADLEGDYWTEVSYESLLAMNPDVMIVPAGASYTAEDILADAQLAEVNAVKNGQVYQMPQDIEEWDSPVPSGILGTLWLTSVLNPDAYSFEEFTADAVAFYETFYGFTIDETLITK